MQKNQREALQNQHSYCQVNIHWEQNIHENNEEDVIPLDLSQVITSTAY
jgi:hypothetical protein